ncbi:hypothetical protein GDO81_021664 [Engystomops pustulosus]|uniref:Uncharacterized protein n=1 Tax=Engystomops pustulosus TaxID=76066 RepID=A0AAV6ZRS3_ENGPU|nr:hypothetical protein GDO81_021664 [Engystomops pustulosus]
MIRGGRIKQREDCGFCFLPAETGGSWLWLAYMQMRPKEPEFWGVSCSPTSLSSPHSLWPLSFQEAELGLESC